MTSVAGSRFDRELTELVERIALDFPATPISVIARIVASVTPPSGPCDSRDLPALLAAVEMTVRQSLLPQTWPAV
jgi:hypothetical protein